MASRSLDSTCSYTARRGLLILLCTLSQTAFAVDDATLKGKVVGIQDGDTITILDASYTQHRIRLKGIDAPERGQPFGKSSKAALSALVYGDDVLVVYAKYDRYGRIVGKVLLNDRDICLAQLYAGQAWFYTDYEKELSEPDRSAYRSAEQDARAARRGLWADTSPVSPWRFRREKHSKSPIPRQLSPTAGEIIGNKRSHTYHRSDCPDYLRVSPANRRIFTSENEAQAAGFRLARNCP